MLYLFQPSASSSVNTIMPCNLSTLPTLDIFLDVPYRYAKTRIDARAYGQQVGRCERSSSIEFGQQRTDDDYD